jgi:hypothetical protein
MTMSSQHPRDLGRAGRRLAGAARTLAVTVVVLVAAACTATPPANNADQRAAGGQAQQQPPTNLRGDLVGLVLSGGSLAREGGRVTLRFRIANQGQDTVTIGDLLGPNGLKVPPSYDASGVYLYDGNARKRYDVVRDGDACRCAKIPLGVDPGQTLELFAAFPDPGQVDQLSAIVPHFPPLDGLRIQG